jgi:hypothetical protein
MEFLVEAHRLLYNMISIYSLIMGAWGIINFFRNSPPDGNYYGGLAVAVGLFVIEGLLGLLLLALGARSGRGLIHILYGVTIVITIPAIFAFTRGRNSSAISFLYGAGMLFIWGLAQRAAETGVEASTP